MPAWGALYRGCAKEDAAATIDEDCGGKCGAGGALGWAMLWGGAWWLNEGAEEIGAGGGGTRAKEGAALDSEAAAGVEKELLGGKAAGVWG